MSETTPTFTVMISYELNDGYTYACQLKRALQSDRLTVAFVDKSLSTNIDENYEHFNKTIQRCSYFIPIITPLYGREEQTNREFKAAFVLKIPIIPIRFVENWPPSCLAIQLSTMQFVYSLECLRALPIGEIWGDQDVMFVSKALKEEFERPKVLQVATGSLEKTSPSSFKIFISYANSESRELALKLKLKLAQLGQSSIYLDQEQITPGCDWHDSLNYGVLNCDFFVPLVSEKYADTEWTKLEAHLAFQLKKITFPIKIVRKWPPASLAIQYNELGYISLPRMANQDESVKLVATELVKKIVQAESEIAEKKQVASGSSK